MNISMQMDARKAIARLESLSLKGKTVSRWNVVYGGKSVRGVFVDYAVYVHEDLSVYHPNGQAKFMEDPARRLAPKFARNVAKALLQKKKLDDVVYDSARELLRETKLLVPVDTGRLRESGRIEKG